MPETKRFHATIEFLGRARAVVETSTRNGGYASIERVDLAPMSFEASGTERARARLYELGYEAAARSAAAKGGALSSFRYLLDHQNPNF